MSSKSLAFNNATVSSKFKEVFCRTIFLKIGDVDSKNEKFSSQVFIEASWEDDQLFKDFLRQKNLSKKFKLI
jgi:hypothetical protein